MHPQPSLSRNRDAPDCTFEYGQACWQPPLGTGVLIPVHRIALCVGVQQLLEGSSELCTLDSQHKADGIHHVGLPAAIGAYHRREGVEGPNFLSAPVGLEVLDLQVLYPALGAPGHARHGAARPITLWVIASAVL